MRRIKGDGLIKFLALLGCFVFIVSASEISAIPETPIYDDEKAALGKKLFFDPILSKDGTVACVTCHLLPGSGAEPFSVSTGIDGQKGSLNSPTVLNSVFNFVQFWDGRAKDLKEQAKGPIVNPIEMGNSEKNLLLTLNRNEAYKEAFNSIYKSTLTFDQVAEVIAEFEKALTTPHSRFDKYLKGDAKALSLAEKKGYSLFKERGCVSCHNGTNIGGTLYQKIGVFKPYIDENDHKGRYAITKNEKDKFYFKVPSLRNIELTAPYIHDGDIKTLEEMVEIMYVYQLGIEPNTHEVHSIVAFLKTLTGEMPSILKENNE